MARADARAADLAPTIAEIRASGVTSMRGIAMALNARNIPTPTGRKEWQAVQVRRVLARL
jgi:recombinase